jgi:hypothetical protein
MQEYQKTTKLLSKKVISHKNRWKNVLFIANNIKLTKKFFGQNKNIMWLMVLNDKSNCQNDFLTKKILQNIIAYKYI